MNAVIYARYSSEKQNEASIEGQIKACRDYADRHGFHVLDTYVDRALTARSDKRPEFQQMVQDSAAGKFQGVLVFQLDRFSRNRFDSALYKKKLTENGVRLFSAKEDIAQDASGILTEGMIETFAEYFSAQLGEKVKRGMNLNAKKCKYNGGSVTLGFSIDNDQNYCVDETMAPIIQTIFERYAQGQTAVEIAKWLNHVGVKTTRGKAFSKTSLQRILRNEKYIGTYSFGDIAVPEGIPRIISNELFYRVQSKLKSEKQAPAHYKAKEEYILTGKLFCGYCKTKMVGSSGKSGYNGKAYRYYVCTNKDCKKKNIPKERIEEIIVKNCYALLTEENIQEIAEQTIASNQNATITQEIMQMEKELKKKEAAIAALMDRLEEGALLNRIEERITTREREIAELKGKIIVRRGQICEMTVDEVIFFLENLKSGDITSKKSMKLFVNTLIHKIYLYDDMARVLFNVGGYSAGMDESELPYYDEILYGTPQLTVVSSEPSASAP